MPGSMLRDGLCSQGVHSLVRKDTLKNKSLRQYGQLHKGGQPQLCYLRARDHIVPW